MKPSQITPKGQQRNIIKVDKCMAKDKTEYTIQYQMSDLTFQEFQGFNESIFTIPVVQMTLMSKQLDKPLSWFSKIGASVLGINTKHQFLVFETSRFLISLDFYEGSRIRIRIGDLMKVLQTETQMNRKNSQIVKTSEGLEWKKTFKEGQFFVQDILYSIKHKELEQAHSKISFNGTHFSRRLWNDICEIVNQRK